MSSITAAKHCPQLPPKLWIQILKNLQDEIDLPELWTSYRQVCKTFKQATESIFADVVLRNTWITFHLGEYQSGSGEETLNPSFNFLRLSEDNSQAIFQLESDNNEETIPLIRERLQPALQNRQIETPAGLVQIHGDVNDGPIPSLVVDHENLNLTFDWRGLYTVFYGEEQLYRKFCDEWVKNQEEWSAGLRQKMERGELDMAKMIEQAIRGFAVASERARMMARRARIKKEFFDLDGTEWDAQRDGDSKAEHSALEKLKMIRSLETTSENSDDESDESDDWEDDDNDSD